MEKMMGVRPPRPRTGAMFIQRSFTHAIRCVDGDRHSRRGHLSYTGYHWNEQSGAWVVNAGISTAPHCVAGLVTKLRLKPTSKEAVATRIFVTRRPLRGRS